MVLIASNFLMVNVAGAGLLTLDTPNLVANYITAVPAPVAATGAVVGAATGVITTGVVVAKSAWEITKDVLSQIAFAAARQYADQITDSTLKWIQGGYHGKPNFNVKPEEFLDELIGSLDNQLVQKIRGASVCKFSLEYIDDLANDIQLSSKKQFEPVCPFPQNFTLTGTEVVGGGVDFLSHSFEEQKDIVKNFWTKTQETASIASKTAMKEAKTPVYWQSYATALSPDGNPYDQRINTFRRREEIKAEKVKIQNDKLNWSSGYIDILSTESCDQEFKDQKADYERQIEDAGANAANDPNYLPIVASLETEYNSYVTTAQKSHCQTLTPGSTIKDMLPKSLQSNMDSLGLVTDINKIIAAVIKQATQKAMREVFPSSKTIAYDVKNNVYTSNNGPVAPPDRIIDGKSEILEGLTRVGVLSNQVLNSPGVQETQDERVSWIRVISGYDFDAPDASAGPVLLAEDGRAGRNSEWLQSRFDDANLKLINLVNKELFRIGDPDKLPNEFRDLIGTEIYSSQDPAVQNNKKVRDATIERDAWFINIRTHDWANKPTILINAVERDRVYVDSKLKSAVEKLVAATLGSVDTLNNLGGYPKLPVK